MTDEEHTSRQLRMDVAMQIMRAWNNGSEGHDPVIVHAINEWIDSGMIGPVPWPESLCFEEWAGRNGLTKVYTNTRHYIGFPLPLLLPTE